LSTLLTNMAKTVGETETDRQLYLKTALEKAVGTTQYCAD